MRFMRTMTTICALVSLLALEAHGADIYITQNASGGNTGANCANAHSAAWFNSNATGGNSYHLCGTFTGAAGGSMFTPPSGSVGNPVIMRFESGAILTAPYWSQSTGAINISSKSYITIDGDYTGTTPCGYVGSGANGSRVSCNGQINNSANGTAANACNPSWPGYANQAASHGIVVANSNNIEIRNLKISGIYMSDGSLACGNDTFGADVTSAIYVNGSSYGILIHNNDLADGYGVLDIGSISPAPSTPISIYNNYLHESCHHISLGYLGSTPTSNFLIHDNEITDWTNWSCPSAANYCTYSQNDRCHADGMIIMSNQYAGGPVMNPYIYNNYIDGDMGLGNTTAMIFCTTTGSGSGSASGCYIFNNVLKLTATTQDHGLIQLGGGTGPHYIYNNTFIATSGYGFGITFDGTGTIIKNNDFDSIGYAFYPAGDGMDVSTKFSQSDYNNFYNLRVGIANDGVSCGYTNCLTLTQWKGMFSKKYDQHSLAINSNLASTYIPNVGSGLIDVGTSLSGLGITALDSDPNGTSRPQGAAWDIGAYEYSVPAVPASPKNLRILQ